MTPDFSKGNGLLPVIIQDAVTMQVLMLGYMNEVAFLQTRKNGVVTFFSRSKKSLWIKGESSGNYLYVQEVLLDCDNDTLLIKVNPAGPACHTGQITCFEDQTGKGYLYSLQKNISHQIDNDIPGSYTNTLYKKGVNKIAQKVGEEAIEVIIEAKDNNLELFKNEVADLLYHLIVLLKTKHVTLEEIEDILKLRSRQLNCKG